MFIVDSETYQITLSKGDTGSISFVTETEYEFATTDRALFTIKNSSGAIIKEVVSEMDEGEFTVNLINSDTDSVAAGAYTWDVRYIINPYYDSNGRIVDGDQVITPMQPMPFIILNVVGEV